MASKKHDLTVSRVDQETDDAVSIAFHIPEELKTEFQYKAGQYIVLVFDINGKEVRRSYSFSSSPTLDKEPTIAVKKVPGGVVSPMLCDDVKAGDEITVMPPRGKFTVNTDPSNAVHYVLFAGGSGITPIISILRTVLDQEPNSRVTLFYGNRDERSIIYLEWCTDLVEKYGDRCTVIHCIEQPTVNWNGEVGRFDRIRVADLYDKHIQGHENAQFFVCGPSPMMVEVQEALKSRNVPKEQVHIEYFTPPPEESPSPMQLKEGTSKLKVILDGDEHELIIEKKKHVLDQLLDEGIDAPYSCMGGVCTTCRAKCLNGETEMVDAYALNDDEVEEGYVLTCSTYAVSDELTLSYDEP